MVSLEVYESTSHLDALQEDAIKRFDADAEWLRSHGIEVKRFDFLRATAAFAKNDVVVAEFRERGPDCLPLLVASGQVIAEGEYPDRHRLAQSPCARRRPQRSF